MRKMMWFSMGFVLSALIGSYLLLPGQYLLASGVCAILLAVCLCCMLRFPKVRLAAMVCFSATLGFLWFFGYDVLYLSAARAYDDQTVSLSITATDYSYGTDYGAATECRVTLNDRSFKLLVYHEKEPSLSPGDKLSGSFLLRCTLEGGAQESSYHRSDRTFITARVRGDMVLTECEKVPWTLYPAVLRHRILQRITETFPEDTAAFACALLLGVTDDLDYETETAFVVSGIRHVIAVSGLHVTILFSLVYIFTGRRKWITALMGIPVLIIFAAVAGFSPSITRACIMHSLMVVGMLFNKEYDPPTALGFAVLCMLCGNPWVVTNIGFQLSVCCMAGILLFAERIKQYLLDKRRLGAVKGPVKKLCGWFATSVAISVSAVIFTTPLCAYYFGVVSLIGVVTNLLTLWIISFIFYGIMLVCCIGSIFPSVATVLAWLVSWPIRYVLMMSEWMASLPMAAVYTSSIYIVIWLIFVYCLLAVFMLSKRKHPLHMICFATIGLCVALVVSWVEPLQDDCRVTVLDVGQGQCILLQSEGKNYLVDCGSDSDDYAADQAASLLLSQGIHRLDGVILTHFDRDHAGGVWNLLTRVPADVLYLPNCIDDDSTSETLYAYTNGIVTTVEADTVLTFGNARITMIPSETAVSNNESGLCILFQTKECDILITGDRSAAGERELIRHMELPELEVLIVGHHGSKSSTCRELLIKTSPEIAIISVGEDNSYGHPTEEVLQRLQDFGCAIYRTDILGTIVFRR